jgi:lipoic acid synthetase
LKKGGMRTKSGVMLGLGESEEEVIETMQDLRSVQVDILTLGQYLQPTPKHLPVAEFITPEKFQEYKELGMKMGFRYVESGPLVRSSYHAEKHLF